MIIAAESTWLISTYTRADERTPINWLLTCFSKGPGAVSATGAAAGTAADVAVGAGADTLHAAGIAAVDEPSELNRSAN
jgi:hypothetical protein